MGWLHLLEACPSFPNTLPAASRPWLALLHEMGTGICLFSATGKLLPALQAASSILLTPLDPSPATIPPIAQS